jgi:polar amino acid transport system permease protein
MNREWSVIWESRDQFLVGFLNTVELTTLSAVGSLLLGILLSLALVSRRRAIAYPAILFVDLMRCVPFLLFAYVIYYALPSIGVRLSNWQAGLTALLLYNVAYMAEAIRAGWRGISRETIDAGESFGFRGLSLAIHIVLPMVLTRILPMVANQVIQIIKDSSFLTIIAVPELTHVANAIQSNYYIPFSSFLVAVLLYWLMCAVVERLTIYLEQVTEARR